MKVPYTKFKTREGDTDEVGGCTFIGGEWKDVDTTEIFDNKKVLSSAPGIGKKAASQIVLDLSDKIAKLGLETFSIKNQSSLSFSDT